MPFLMFIHVGVSKNKTANSDYSAYTYDQTVWGYYTACDNDKFPICDKTKIDSLI